MLPKSEDGLLNVWVNLFKKLVLFIELPSVIVAHGGWKRGLGSLLGSHHTL